jgi:DNA polymerase-3 subunit beta
MKFEISKSDLSRMLSEASSVAAKKKAAPASTILSNVKIASGDGFAQVSSTNQIIAYTSQCNVENTGEQESYIVDAHSANKLVSLLPESKLGVETNPARTHLCIRVLDEKLDPVEIRLQCWGARDFPDFPAQHDELGYEVDGASLTKLITSTKASMSHNVAAEHMNGVFLSCKDGTAVAAATDGVRLLRYTKPIPDLVIDPPVFLPEDGVSAAARFIDESEKVRVYVGNDHVFFARGGACIAMRYLSGMSFSKYERVIPKDLASSIRMKTSAFLVAVEQLMTMTSGRDEVVAIEIGPEVTRDTVMFETSNPDIGVARVRIGYSEPRGPGKHLRMGCNIRSMSEMVGAMADCESVEFSFAGPLDAFTIRPTCSDDLLAVMAPMRLQ